MDLSHGLMLCGTSVLGVLGAVHLLYTYRGNKLEPRDPALRAAMERSWFFITRETTVWRAVKGFHATHSLGAIGLALVYGHLALAQPLALESSPFLSGLGLALLLAYLALAWRYFFSIPLRGIALATVLYAVGWALQ